MMPRPIHILIRKCKTFGLTVAKCSNWPSISLAKIGLGRGPEILRFRDGFQLKPIPPLWATWGEIFEPAIADLYGFRDTVPDLIVDIGANMGSFTCWAAYLRPKAVVHAFEPSEKHAGWLEKNATLNALPNISVHRKAVTKDGRDVLYSHFDAGGSSGIFLHGEGRVEKIPSTSLDCVDFAKSASVFFKIDCEGAEGEIIEWVCEHLAQLPPRIQIAAEWHHWCPVPREQSIKLLRDHGFVAEGRILFDESYVFASRSLSS